MAEETLYFFLGLPSSDSTVADIRKAYLKKARETHPDKAGKGSEQTFNKVNEAFLVLSDKEKRREYDLTLQRPAPRRPVPSRQPPSSSTRGTSRPADDTQRASPGRPRAFYPAAQHQRRNDFVSSEDSSEDSQSDLDSPVDANRRWQYRSEYSTSEDDESIRTNYSQSRLSSFSSTSSNESTQRPRPDRSAPGPQQFRQQSVPPTRPSWGFRPPPDVTRPQQSSPGPSLFTFAALRGERERGSYSPRLHERRSQSRPPPLVQTTMPRPPQGRSKSYQGYDRQQLLTESTFSPPTSPRYSPGYNNGFLWGLREISPSRPSYELASHPSSVRPPPPGHAPRARHRPKMPFLPPRTQTTRPPPSTFPSSPSAHWHPPPPPPPPSFRSGPFRGSYSRSGGR